MTSALVLEYPLQEKKLHGNIAALKTICGGDLKPSRIKQDQPGKSLGSISYGIDQNVNGQFKYIRGRQIRILWGRCEQQRVLFWTMRRRGIAGCACGHSCRDKDAVAW